MGTGERSIATAPSLLTRFFGDATTPDELARMLQERRSVTLIGAPGCGKTRLALEATTRFAGQFTGGACFVELAAVSEPSCVSTAVAVALGVADESGRSAEDALIDALTSEHLVLVLDNCEHVLEPVAALVTRLLASCPSLAVLLTSRTLVGVPDELAWTVPPLDLASAVGLFRDRAALLSPAMANGAADDAVVERICRGLDGLPLAIELVAAWTQVLTPLEIAARLDQALPLLRSHTRDVDPRQRTMDATVDWSHRLLPPDQRLLFERLSVFAGGFDLDAAEVVAGRGGPSNRDEVAEGLAALVAHSLLMAEPTEAASARYRLLEPVRQWAELRLEAGGERQTIRRRHAEHYLEVALRLDAQLRTDDAGAALTRWVADGPNFRRALEWARGASGTDLGLRLSTAVARAWAIEGRISEGRAWLEEMLRSNQGSADRQLRASALARASRLAWRQLDYPAARALLEESLTVDGEHGDPLRTARRLRSLALVAMAQDDFDEAERLGSLSVRLFRRHGDDYGLSLALAFLGMMLHLAGAHDRADPHVEEALELNDAAGNVAGGLYSIGAMAFGALAAGELDDLRAHIARMVDMLRTLDGNHEDPGWLWSVAAALAAGEGRWRAALRLAGAGEATARRDGLELHQRLRAQVVPWLEQARVVVGSTEAARLAAAGSHMRLDQLLEDCVSTVEEPDRASLSQRELEITGLIADGLTNSEIARRLVISRRTVESHLHHIKAKLGLTRRASIVAWALDRRPPACPPPDG